MKIIDFFDRVYVLNLAYRKDRLKSITRELKQLDMILGTDKVRLFSAIRPADPRGFPEVGWRGCFLSHLEALKLARRDNLNNVLIIEDDSLILPKLRATQGFYLDQLAGKDWGFVYFCCKPEELSSAGKGLHRFNGDLISACFYGVNSKILNNLIGFLEKIEESKPVEGMHKPGLDHAYNIFRTQNPDVTYIAVPHQVTQEAFCSDVWHSNESSWITKVPLIFCLASWLRRWKRYFFDIN